jgi:transcriptional regulator with XRE-family HTH domain
MKRKHFSYRRLAESINASKQTVTNWTQGTHEPRLRHIRRLSEALEIPVARLLDDEGPANAAEGDAVAIVEKLAGLGLSSSIDSLSQASPALLDLLTQAERQVLERRKTTPGLRPR